MTKLLAHCGRCGAPGIRHDGSKRYECAACGWVFYINPVAATAAILEVEGKVLLTIRATNPSAGMLDLPGGFVDTGETNEQALCRELAEELGITLEPGRLRYLGSFPNRYTFAAITYDTVDAIFTAKLDGVPAHHDSGELSGFELLAPDQIDLDRLAFASIRAAIRVYRGD